MKSILIKDTTKEEREQIIKSSLDCGGGCENCSSCWLGGGSPWDIYQDYIDGKREIKEINAEYMSRYRQDRQIMCGLCTVFSGKDAETAYADYIQGVRSFTEVSDDYKR